MLKAPVCDFSPAELLELLEAFLQHLLDAPGHGAELQLLRWLRRGQEGQGIDGVKLPGGGRPKDAKEGEADLRLKGTCPLQWYGAMGGLYYTIKQKLDYITYPILYYARLCYTILCCTVLYCTVLYSTITTTGGDGATPCTMTWSGGVDHQHWAIWSFTYRTI